MDFDSIISLDKAKEVLSSGVSQAQEMLKDTSKIDKLLEDLEVKLQEVPTIGATLADLPLMISMIKSYISKEYEVVSPKVIALMVSSLIYVAKGRDLIKDSIPVLGQLDDIAIVAVALKLNEPELQAYKEWRETKKDGSCEACKEEAAPAEASAV